LKVIGTVVDVREFVEAFLLSLLRKVKLPDVEFVINYRFQVLRVVFLRPPTPFVSLQRLPLRLQSG
jgi:hypothetical protein